MSIHDLAAFATLAEEGSFTRAAAKLGMPQSSLSRLIKGLEQRLGVRLLSRTTRSVATTEAGEALLATLRPALTRSTRAWPLSAPCAERQRGPSG
ncbi:LysR family transcriptional regulator [Archangium violaceum]|uniref:LysR family transcriptional regulator n=1 Tax=Archangium violaceum TaxID=83451 RepID=UPI0037C140B8